MALNPLHAQVNKFVLAQEKKTRTKHIKKMLSFCLLWPSLDLLYCGK